MRSGIGNSASDPLFVSSVSGGAQQGSATNPTFEKSIGADNVATGQGASSLSPTAATQVVAARAGRRSVTITNITGTQPVYIGASGVTVANGFFLAGTVGASITVATSAALFATSPTAAQTLSFIETF